MYNPKEERRKRPTVGSLIGLLIALAMFSPELLAIVIVVGAVVLPVYLAVRITRKSRQTPKEDTFDECPKPVCFHSDKGEHHIRRGREIDPWDRPDIDIRKYQRK